MIIILNQNKGEIPKKFKSYLISHLQMQSACFLLIFRSPVFVNTVYFTLFETAF